MAHVIRKVEDVGAKADHRGLMADRIDTLQSGCQQLRVANVPFNELGAGRNFRSFTVRACQQRVEHTHVMAVCQQLLNNV